MPGPLRLALLPIARAELIGLQGVEHAQHFINVAADGEIGNHNETNDAFRVNDISGALGDTGVGVEDAERGGEFALDVGEHGERQIFSEG